MKKLLVITLGLLMLAGCSKSIDMPKLKAKDITLNYGDKIDLDFEDVIEESRLDDKQMDELKKNGEINLGYIQYDESGNAKVGKHIIKVSYYSDVVECQLTVQDTTLPVFNDVDEVEVNYSYLYYDFSQNIIATSPIGLPLTYTFDNTKINFYEIGTYPLDVTVTDSLGRSVSKTITVHIV